MKGLRSLKVQSPEAEATEGSKVGGFGIDPAVMSRGLVPQTQSAGGKERENKERTRKKKERERDLQRSVRLTY